MKSFKLNLFVIATFSSLPIYAKVVEIDLSLYGKGTMLANSVRDKQSAAYWHQLSNRIIASEAKLGTQAMWQYAGLSEALAAISANKYDDVKAYEYWSNSTRYLLTGGTEWTQMQKYLHRRYEQINTQLSTQLTISNIGVSLDSTWEQELTILQVWDEKLEVFIFKGPKLGLQAHSLPISPSMTTPPKFKSKKVTNGEKKLTGLETSFSREQTFTPITEAESHSFAIEDNQPKVGIETIKETSGSVLNENKLDQVEASVTDNKERSIQVNTIVKSQSKLPKKEGVTEGLGILADRNVVVITPDEEFDYQKAEKEHDDIQIKKVNATEKAEAQETTYAPIHKVNIGNKNTNKVEVLQRRTFIPITDDSKGLTDEKE